MNMEKHVCEICQKEFQSGSQLGSHKRVHTRKLVECEICKKKFGLFRIESHKIQCEEKEKLSKRQCEKCLKEFKSYYNRFCSRSCANSHVVSEEHKLKTSKSLKCKETESFLANRQNKNCKYCGKATISIDNKRTKAICETKCKEFKEFISKKMSASLLGKSGGYRKGGGRGKGAYYQGIWMDSTWEFSLARKLDDLSILWERDNKHRYSYSDIDGKERKYYPDFFIPHLDLYIEVKGYWTEEIRHKMRSVKDRHPNLKILILESLEEIKNLKFD